MPRPALRARVFFGSLAFLAGACLDPGQLPGETDTESTGPSPYPSSDTLSIVEMGSAGFLLRGTVLAPDGVLDPGEVLIVGDTITCVAADCSAQAAAVTVIETTGVIAPGLIDAHNHIAYDFLPEWVPDPPMLFDNRYVWADDPTYEEHVLPYSAHGSTGTHFCPGAKWGELRAIVHGTTTVQGQSQAQACIDRLARNADSFHGLGYDHMQTTIGSPRDIDDEAAATYLANFTAAQEPTTRFGVHMTEGVMGDNVELEFSSFAGRDDRDNRHAGQSLLAGDGFQGVALLIHAVSLTSAELQEVAATGSKIVWSPSSNMVLYGTTAPIGEILQLGITVGLGPDWTVSGEDDMLAEMKFALEWAQAEGEGAVTPAALFQMATAGSADAVGLGESIGRLAPDMRADVVVFGRTDPADPYRSIAMSTAADVHLVMIDGLVYYGDAEVESIVALNDECDAVDACGAAKFMCVKNTPGSSSRADESYQDIATQLFNIMEGIGYPPEEQYGRGDEVLPLITCEG